MRLIRHHRAAARAALLALAGWAAALAAPAAEPRPVSVVAVESAAAPHARTLDLRGATEATRTVEVRAQISGLVVSDPPRAGARVAAGETLCELDPGERPAALAEAEADLRRAEVEHQAAVRLRDKGFTAETESLTRAAALETARAQLDRARIDMGRLTIAAPFAGVLDADAAERGALLQPGDLCATVLALDPITVVGYAAETVVDRLAPGQKARVRLAAGRDFDATIRFVAAAADPDTRTYRVEATAPNPDGAVRAGMTADIRVALDPVDAHRLPQSALTLDGDGRLGVRLAEEGLARFVPVSILAEETGGLWLLGLPERATVIVVGQEFVGEGQPVAVTVRDAPPGAPAAAPADPLPGSAPGAIPSLSPDETSAAEGPEARS